MTNDLPDNFPINISQMKNVLIQKNIPKLQFNIMELMQNYGNEIANVDILNLCMPLKNAKKLFEQYNIEKNTVDRIINFNIDRIELADININDISYSPIYSNKDIGNIVKQGLTKKEKQIARTNIGLKVKQKKDRVSYIEAKEGLVSKLADLKGQRIAILDLEFDSNNNDKIKEIGIIYIDTAKQSFEYEFILLDKEKIRYNPHNMFKLSLVPDNSNLSTLELGLERVQDILSKSDIVAIYGGQEDKKILRKNGIELNLKIIDLQKYVSILNKKHFKQKISLINALKMLNSETTFDNIEQDFFNQNMQHLIDKDKSLFKKKGKLHNINNIPLHTAFNDAFATFLVLEKILSTSNNFQLSFLKDKIKKEVETSFLSRLNHYYKNEILIEHKPKKLTI